MYLRSVLIVRKTHLKLVLSQGQIIIDMKSRVAGTNDPGYPGIPGVAGKNGEGGCGEYVDKCSAVGSGAGFSTKCVSKTSCSGKYKGKDCEPNKDGKNGTVGKVSEMNEEPLLHHSVSVYNVIPATSVHQDFLLKYAIALMNQETIDESQEILTFLTKFNSATSVTANKLLSTMNKNGQIESDRKPTPRKSFSKLEEKISRRISRGKKVESALGKLGKLFSFTDMVYEIFDTMLEVTEDELQETRNDLFDAQNNVAESYQSLEKMETRLLYINKLINDDIELLVNYINLQIHSLEMAAARQKRCAIVGSVLAFVPVVGGGIRGSASKAIEAAFYAEIENKLGELECEQLTIFDFLEQFTYKFSLLGEDVSKLRTPEDFKNFEPNALKEFFSGDLRDIIQGEDFYIDTTCLLGLVEVKNKPPDFGLSLPSLSDFIPGFEFAESITALTEAGVAITKCAVADDPGTCYLKECKTIIHGINVLFDSGLSCQLLNFEQLQEWVETVENWLKKLSEKYEDMRQWFEDTFGILGLIADFVTVIMDFVNQLLEIMRLDIFDGHRFDNMLEVFQGKFYLY